MWLKQLSIGGGHTNTFLRQVKAGVKAVVSKMQDKNGNLNADEICVNKPDLRLAVDKGLKWFVMHWKCPFVWPLLPHLIQGALNIEAKGVVGEVECALNFHMEWMASIECGEVVDWHKIEEIVSQSLPNCSGYMHALAQYVEANSGGEDAELLRQLSSISNVFECSDTSAVRAVGGEYLLACTNLSKGFGTIEKYPLIVHAALVAQYLSPKIIDGFCRLLYVALVNVPKTRTSKQQNTGCKETTYANCV